MRYKSISIRLTISILVYVALLFVVAFGIVAWTSYNTIAEEATHATSNRLDAMIKEIEQPMVEVEVSTFSCAQVMRSVLHDDAFLTHITREVVCQSDKVIGCAVAFADGVHHGDHWFAPYSYRDSLTGQVSTKQLGHAGYDYYAMEWFRIPYETGLPHWSNPYYDRDGGERLMTTYSIPLKDSAGCVVAIVTADVAIDWIDSLVSSIQPYAGAVAAILCPDETVIGIDDPTVLETVRLQGGDNPGLAKLHHEMKKGGDSLVRFRVGHHWAYAVYAPLRMGWSASIVCQYQAVLQPATQMLYRLIAIGLIGLLLLGAACYYAVRRATHPIVNLSKAVANMSEGNFQMPLPVVNTHDELQQFHDSFEQLQHSLADYIEELRTTTEAKGRMENELGVARDIQQGMLRTDFLSNIHARLIPAKEVGGDLYDFVSRDDGTLYFAVGDVSGKGVPAALMMSITCAALRFVAHEDMDLASTVDRVNNSIAESNSSGMFVTLFVGCFDRNTMTMHFCNAGHNPILVIPPEGDPYLLSMLPNLALGVLPDYPYRSEQLQLSSGTRLVLYTDGVTEAERADQSQYGIDRLLAWAQSPAARTAANPQAVADSLYASLQAFVGDNCQNDDITILCIDI